MNVSAIINRDTDTVDLDICDQDWNITTLAHDTLSGLMKGVTVEIVTERGGYFDACDILDTRSIAWHRLDDTCEVERDIARDAVEDEVREWAARLGHNVSGFTWI